MHTNSKYKKMITLEQKKKYAYKLTVFYLSHEWCGIAHK